ncbi:hypothetical protein GCM10027277_07910 [Pseudoduganella ginsengisoli]
MRPVLAPLALSWYVQEEPSSDRDQLPPVCTPSAPNSVVVTPWASNTVSVRLPSAWWTVSIEPVAVMTVEPCSPSLRCQVSPCASPFWTVCTPAASREVRV